MKPSLRARLRPQTVGGDQRMAALVPQAARAARRHRDAVRMGGEILHAHAELERNVELLRDRGDERGLQIAAMDDPVWRAVALLPPRRAACARFRGRSAPAKHAQRRGRDDMRPQPLAEPRSIRHARGIGRKLDAGAGFLKPLGLFQHDDAKAVARQRQRGRQSADAGAGDDDAARGRHGTEVQTDGFAQGTFRRPRLHWAPAPDRGGKASSNTGRHIRHRRPCRNKHADGRTAAWRRRT